MKEFTITFLHVCGMVSFGFVRGVTSTWSELTEAMETWSLAMNMLVAVWWYSVGTSRLCCVFEMKVVKLEAWARYSEFMRSDWHTQR